MTAFVPIPAREAAELVEAAGIPHARRVLIDSAAAGLVDTYAMATLTFDTRDRFATVRGAAIPLGIWHRMAQASDIDSIWCGGTVRLAGNGLTGGVPDVHVTGVGFGERSLQRLIASHIRTPPAAVTTKPVAVPHPAVVAPPASMPPTPPSSASPGSAPQPSPAKSRRVANPSCIPPGAITVTVNQTMDITGLGRTTIDKLMGEGVLERVKVGGRTLITVVSIRRLLGDEPAST